MPIRNRAPSAAPAWPVQTWSATGKCSHAGHPATAAPHRIPRVPQRYRCTQIPGQKRCVNVCATLLSSLALTFLHARTIFFRSYSAERPWTVVSVFRPLLCWILICTSPSCTFSSAPLIASANGSGRGGRDREGDG